MITLKSKQNDNGFTQCPHNILDALISAKLSGTQYAIVMLIIRNSYGYHRNSCTMSLNVISNIIGIDRAFASRQLNQLIKNKIVIASGAICKAKELSINPNINDWILSNCCITVQQRNDTAVVVEYNNNCCTTVQKSIVAEYNHINIRNIDRNIDNSNTCAHAREDSGKIFKIYEQNIASLSPLVVDELKDLLQNHSPELIELAISEAVKANVRNIKYICGIIRNWDNANIKTIDAAQLAIENHSKAAERKTTGQKQENNSDDGENTSPYKNLGTWL